MSDFVAGRDLYRGGRLIFAVGAPVPEDAFPPETMAELRHNGALRRAEPDVVGIWDLTVHEAEPVIAALPLDALAAVEARELQNPHNPGGRVGVLRAIRARRSELEAPSEPPSPAS